MISCMLSWGMVLSGSDHEVQYQVRKLVVYRYEDQRGGY